MDYCSVPLECELVERHFAVTQAFIPLDGTPSVMVVAAPGGPAEVAVPGAFRAFAVPGSSGIMLWRGTWHAVTRFPLRAAGGRFALISGRETQAELAHASNGGPQPKLTETLNFVERYQTKLAIVDPHGLLVER
jgi:ureidoglycolate hydrolase